MNIDWVIPCRYVEVHDNLGTIVGAGIDTLWVEALPAPVQVVLAMRLLATVDEFEHGESHRVTNRMRDPQGEIVSEVTGELTAAGELARPEWLAGIMLGSVVQFEAAEEGTYTLELEVDESSDALPIHLVLGAP